MEVNAQGDVLLTPQSPPAEPAAAADAADTATPTAAMEAPAASGEGLQPGSKGVSSRATSPLLPLVLGAVSNGNGNGHSNGKVHSNGNGNGHSNGNGKAYSNGNGYNSSSVNGAPNGNGKPSLVNPPKGPLSYSNGTGAAAASSNKSAAGTDTTAAPLPLVLREDQFAAGCVGAKALHLAALRARLPAWVLVPASVALPFPTWDTTLAAPCNADAAQRLAGLTAQLEAAGAAGGGLPGELLASIRQLVATELVPPPGLQQVSPRQGLDTGMCGTAPIILASRLVPCRLSCCGAVGALFKGAVAFSQPSSRVHTVHGALFGHLVHDPSSCAAAAGCL